MQRTLFSTTLFLIACLAASETLAQWGPCPPVRRCYGSPRRVYQPPVVYYYGPCYTGRPRAARGIYDPRINYRPVVEHDPRRSAGLSAPHPASAQPYPGSLPPSPGPSIVVTDDKHTNGASIAVPVLPDIEATLVAKGQFKKVLEAAKVAKVLEELGKGGPFTVFVPNDRAFEQLGDDVFERLIKDPQKLNELLFYHALPGRKSLGDAVKDGKVETVLNLDLTIRRIDNKIFVNTAQVVEADVNCGNGVIHVIDHVLLPPGFQLPEADSSQPEGTDP